VPGAAFPVYESFQGVAVSTKSLQVFYGVVVVIAVNVINL
jgi:hypothetical protein